LNKTSSRKLISSTFSKDSRFMGNVWACSLTKRWELNWLMSVTNNQSHKPSLVSRTQMNPAGKTLSAFLKSKAILTLRMELLTLKTKVSWLTMTLRSHHPKVSNSIATRLFPKPKRVI
jgi:hypothetical protein